MHLKTLLALSVAPVLVLGATKPALASTHSHGAGAACLTCGGGLLPGGTTGYQPIDRWTSTFTNGGGIVQGTPITLTWSIVPDGTDIAGEIPNSSLISALDSAFGSGGGSDLTTRPWFSLFSQSFDRWSELAGLDYVYVTDDGAQHSNSFPGSSTRGDVRIAGVNIDGAGGTLAYNYFPNRGDMVIDTADVPGFFGNSNNNFRAGRNIVMHEHGHGMGIAHVVSNNASFLMEPSINTSFDGPQFDDILSAQRLYGDVLEKNGGNDTAATATSFGALPHGASVSIGFDAVDAFVSPNDTSFVSIDDDSDVDFYSFTVDAFTGITIDLTPLGPTYNEGEQGGSQTALVTSAMSNLTLALYDTDGTSLLASVNETGLGGSESILFDLIEDGTYFVRVGGLNNNIQMYQLDLLATAIPEPAAGALLAGGLLIALRRRRAA